MPFYEQSQIEETSHAEQSTDRERGPQELDLTGTPFAHMVNRPDPGALQAGPRPNLPV